MKNRSIVIIAHNLRSCHNVGSLLRTAEGLGIDTVYLTGYSPHPRLTKDSRLPHLALKIHNQIHKTALGAEETQAWQYVENINDVVAALKKTRYIITALEQTQASFPLHSYEVPDKVAILLGREVEGIEPAVLALCDEAVEIPMNGSKESFNVVQAAAMAAFYCKFWPFKH